MVTDTAVLHFVAGRATELTKLPATVTSATRTSNSLFVAGTNGVWRIELEPLAMHPCEPLPAGFDPISLTASPTTLAVSIAEQDFGDSALLVSDHSCASWQQVFAGADGQMSVDFSPAQGLWLLRTVGVGGGGSLWSAKDALGPWIRRSPVVQAMSAILAEGADSALVGGAGPLRRVRWDPSDAGVGEVQVLPGPTDIRGISPRPDGGFWMTSYASDTQGGPFVFYELDNALTVASSITSSEDEVAQGVVDADGRLWFAGTSGLTRNGAGDLVRPSVPDVSQTVVPTVSCRGVETWQEPRAGDGVLRLIFARAENDWETSSEWPRTVVPLWGPYERDDAILFWGAKVESRQARLAAEIVGTADLGFVDDDASSAATGLKLPAAVVGVTEVPGSADVRFQIQGRDHAQVIRWRADGLHAEPVPETSGRSLAALDPYDPLRVSYVESAEDGVRIHSFAGGSSWLVAEREGGGLPVATAVGPGGRIAWLNDRGELCDEAACVGDGVTRIWTGIRDDGETTIVAQTANGLLQYDGVSSAPRLLSPLPAGQVAVYRNLVLARAGSGAWSWYRLLAP